MWRFSFILLLLPLSAQASCTDNNDPDYNFAVSQGNYENAFQLVAQELRLTSADRHHFKIVQGFSQAHDNRHGQADPDSLDLNLDPGLFIEGKEGACQGVAHELAHLRQFQRDRRHLHDYFSKYPVPEKGWNGCERDALSKPESDEAEDEAYTCLQDNDLVPHAASDEIAAVLAQIPYAAQHTLRSDDFNYLLDNLKTWSDHASLVNDASNESYYLPDIKREDVRIFCKGTAYAQKNFANPAPFQPAWLAFCRVRP